MNFRPFLIATVVIAFTTLVFVLLGLSLLLGLSIGFALGLLVGFFLLSSQPAPRGHHASAPNYDPELVLGEVEAAFVKVKRSLKGEVRNPLETEIYQAFRETLRYLPAQSVAGANEIWSTVQRDLLAPTLSDLQFPDDAATQQQRIAERCARLPVTLQALATTLLPDGTTSLASREGSTFYLDNLYAMPAIKDALPGSAVEKLATGHYFRVGADVFLVKERFIYRCGNDVWHEVLGESLRDGSVKALEWEVDDHQLEVFLQTEAALSLEDLGLQLSTLKKIDNEEQGSISFRGTNFRYDESDKATCQSVETLEIENFYYYDFVDSRSGQILGVERWGSETKAYLMRTVSSRELEIFMV